MLSRGNQGESSFSIGAVLGGSVLSFAVTFVGAILLGAAVSWTEWNGLSSGLSYFSYAAVAIGGMWAAKRSRRMGWVHGGVVGVAFVVISALLFQPDFQLNQLIDSTVLIKIIWSAAAGALGGVLGVNFS